MSANFYINSGKMIGIDFHHFQAVPTSVKELATGHRVEVWPYVVSATNSDPGGDEDKRTQTITADGEKMIRDGFEIFAVNHQFVPGPAHPYEFVEQAKIV